MTPDEIAGARWFRSKLRPVASVTEVDRAGLGAGALVVVEVAYADGGPPDRYLLTDPADGRGIWSAIVRAMAADADISGRSGRFATSHTAALVVGGSLDERRLGVEQSNTSAVVGERLILKLYRLLEPGDNPDVEVAAFLTEVGFAGTPAVAGEMRYIADGGAPAAAALLQEYVRASGDGWAATLAALATDPARATRLAADIGVLTARMHAALASRPDDSVFPARSATEAETAAWRASAERQLAEAVGALSGRDHERLVTLAPAIRARFADAFGEASRATRISRIHGDYHLGQLLARDDGGFSVIDFEGEPARSLDERRRPASPLRDVAGMLRSLDYAARTAAAAADDLDADAWLTAARAAFLAGYGAVSEPEARLLDAFELEKACYEVRYEANNRPGWLWLPMGALERLVTAATPEGGGSAAAG